MPTCCSAPESGCADGAALDAVALLDILSFVGGQAHSFQVFDSIHGSRTSMLYATESQAHVLDNAFGLGDS